MTLNLPEKYVGLPLDLTSMPTPAALALIVEHAEQVQRNFEAAARDRAFSAVTTAGGLGTFIGNGTGVVSFLFAHGMGRLPSSYTAIALGWTGYFVAQGASTTVDMDLQAIAAGTFTAATTYYFYWQARG